MKSKLFAVTAIAIAMLAGQAQAQVIIFQEDFEVSPINSLQVPVNVPVAPLTTQTDPLDASNMVGVASTLAAVPAVVFETTIVPLPANAANAEFLLDINVPTGSTGNQQGLYFGALDFLNAAGMSLDLDGFNPNVDSSLDTVQSFTSGPLAIPTGAVAVQGTIGFLTGDLSIDAGTLFFIDDVTIQVSNVPEPSSLALIGLCGFATVLRRRR